MLDGSDPNELASCFTANQEREYDTFEQELLKIEKSVARNFSCSLDCCKYFSNRSVSTCCCCSEVVE